MRIDRQKDEGGENNIRFSELSVSL